MKIKLIITACGFCLLFTTGWAQINLDAEPPTGKFYVDGIVITSEGSKQSLGYTPKDLLFLLCATNEIPGYTVVVPEYRPDTDRGTFKWAMPYGHTYVDLNRGGNREVPKERVSCSILRTWVSEQRAQAYLAREIPSYTQLVGQDSITLEVWLYASTARPIEERVRYSTAPYTRGTPSGSPLGDESWYIRHSRGKGGVLLFRYDKCRVDIEAPDLELAEAIAQSVLYRLMVHPKRVVQRVPSPQIRVNRASSIDTAGWASLNGVVVVPASTLKALGVEVDLRRGADFWQATLRRGNQWIEIRAFGWTARTAEGEFRLERAAFPFEGDLVVPLRAVAQALGLTVEVE